MRFESCKDNVKKVVIFMEEIKNFLFIAAKNSYLSMNLVE